MKNNVVRVILIEDSETQAFKMRLLLEAEGYEVVTVGDAESALSKLNELSPDLILADYFLPGMDGGELCRQVRGNLNTRDIPILMLTHAGTTEAHALESGADDYVSKSENAEVLLVRIRALVRKTHEHPSALNLRESGFRPTRILTIGDGPTRDFVRGALLSEGYEVENAISAAEGIRKLAAGTFDCALVDMVTAGISGIEVCRQITEMRDPLAVPVVVIMMTTVDSTDELTRCLAAGADDVVAKSTDTAILRARIQALLRRRSFQEENRRLAAQAKEKEIEKVRARAELESAEAGAALSKELLRANQKLEAANAKLEETKAHLIETERLAAISFRDTLTQIGLRSQERKASEDSLRESEERYALAVQGANDGVWDWKLDTGEIYFSPRWNQILGFPENHLWTDPEEWLGRIHPGDQARVRAALAAHRENQTPDFTSEYRIRHANGSYLWILSRGVAVRDAAGTAVRIAGSHTDINEGKVSDALTGLRNRVYFLDKLECSIEIAKGNDDCRFAVLFVDLDRFKMVNDTLGHATGDQLLIGMAGRLRASVRSEDRIAGTSVVARVGGDEFAVLLDGLRHDADAVAVAERILNAFDSPFEIGRRVFASISVGIAYGSPGATAEQLLHNADTAMYCAKAKGKGRYDVFDEGMRSLAVSRSEIELELRSAIESEEMTLHYQPVVALSDERIIGFEALVRWKHPVRGLLYPDSFIQIAEDAGLIVPLGRWVLGEACRQMAEWHGKCAADPPLTISVNVSFRQLIQPGLVEDVELVLAKTGLNPGSLKLEMTESSLMESTNQAIAIVQKLKSMHIGLEIDDFGTGYSSLSYLCLLPFDTLKIDRSFVMGMARDNENLIIVRTILNLARSLNLRAVAEGIETESQLTILKDTGCQFGQGYYFSKPVAAADAERLFNRKAEAANLLVPAGHGAGGSCALNLTNVNVSGICES
ncbi:MAG: EAL domain-containing protein [Bryobacteraceae bacterium]